jgi:methylmalonyl-CoA mutase C-terminal domain/subunit
LGLFSKVRSLLNKQGAKNIVVIGGGIIPQKDKKIMEKHGTHGNSGPGTSLKEIIEYIKKKCNS